MDGYKHLIVVFALFLSACRFSYQEEYSMDRPAPVNLKLAKYAESILRKKMEEVRFPLSEEDKQIIQNMKYSIQKEQLKAAGAPWDSAAGMAANQWGIDKRIFIYCPTGASEKELEVVINPHYTPIFDLPSQNAAVDDEWEGCFSIPLATGKVKRYTHIQVIYQNQKGETIKKELKGWYARVFQHETDHLDGTLYDSKCSELHRFNSREEVDEFYAKIRAQREKKSS